jgi:hypothetical protein
LSLRGQNVKKKVGVMLSFLTLLLLPSLVLADCADLSYFTGWALEDEHRVLFYMGKSLWRSSPSPIATSIPRQRSVSSEVMCATRIALWSMVRFAAS